MHARLGVCVYTDIAHLYLHTRMWNKQNYEIFSLNNFVGLNQTSRPITMLNAHVCCRVACPVLAC